MTKAESCEKLLSILNKHLKHGAIDGGIDVRERAFYYAKNIDGIHDCNAWVDVQSKVKKILKKEKIVEIKKL